jgi:hypothetical protein
MLRLVQIQLASFFAAALFVFARQNNKGTTGTGFSRTSYFCVTAQFVLSRVTNWVAAKILASLNQHVTKIRNMLLRWRKGVILG